MLRLEVKPNDIVLFDRRAIDPRTIQVLAEDDEILRGMEGTVFIPVNVPPGRTVADVIAVATDEQKKEWCALARS